MLRLLQFKYFLIHRLYKHATLQFRFFTNFVRSNCGKRDEGTSVIALKKRNIFFEKIRHELVTSTNPLINYLLTFTIWKSINTISRHK